MSDNVYKFRRLKWGHPERKLKMLPEKQRRREVPWVEVMLMASIAISLGVVLYHLL